MSTAAPTSGGDQSAPAAPSEHAGKLRTWWHPLLAGLLRWQTAPVYEVQEEISVGRMPLEIDLLLIRKTAGRLTEESCRILAGLVECLNDFTLVEFKGPSDDLEAGDFRTLLAYAHLYCAQQQPGLAPNRLNLVVIAPRLTAAYGEELRLCGVAVQTVAPGIHQLTGPLFHATWVIETAVAVGLERPLLTLFSPAFLRDYRQLTPVLRKGGYANLVDHVTQQIQQFRRAGENFALHHSGTEEMDRMTKELKLEILQESTPEERRYILSQLPREDRLALLRDMPREDRLAVLRDMPREDWLALAADLSPEAAAHFQAFLQALPK